MQLIEYPKCSTCKNAKKYLQEHKINFEDRNIITETPSAKELQKWVEMNSIPLNKLFNTSGIKYRELNLKEQRQKMSEEEQFSLLASDGMLIKRPILVTDEKILVGFREKEWNEYFENKQ